MGTLTLTRYVPAELGYGSAGAGEDIPPDAPLFCDCELKEARSPG